MPAAAARAVVAGGSAPARVNVRPPDAGRDGRVQPPYRDPDTGHVYTRGERLAFLDPRNRGYRGYAKPPPDPTLTGLPLDALAAIIAELSGANDAQRAQQAAAEGREGAAALHGIAALPGVAKLLKLAGKGAAKGVKAIQGSGKTAEPGALRRANESMKDRASDYQSRLTGTPPGHAYYVDGIKFDGFTDGVLIEAKGPGYAKFLRHGEFPDWFDGAQDMVEQAQRQLRVAKGVPVTWVVAEPEAAAAIRRLLAERGIIGITIKHVPAGG
jgi:hypothetical protein